MPMLKVPDHQVAGHKALNGKLGPLIDDSGRFYKPLQSGERGSHEVAFYESFSADTSVPDNVRKFFPKFYGTQSIEASDGSGLQPHLVMEDLMSNYTNPSIMDVKIGSRTWYPQAPDEYFQKCLKKDMDTSTVPLGFRVSGLQIYRAQDSDPGYWKPSKKVTQRYTADEVKLVLRKFVSSNQSTEVNNDPDSAYASNVYGGSSGILAQLMELKSWFEDQTTYHFYSCSILIAYDKESTMKGASLGPAFKLIDFAHVIDGNGVIDHNFLGGLCSLIKFISEILTIPAECTDKTSS
ncbi:inositol polyphosphate multikinase beta-like [Silene latifolia]|uniref:inositol polyphosphate multikinase beta-like n=1 Tax=Silene latifolia TaxID=37657 RepID=UPI003D772B3D